MVTRRPLFILLKIVAVAALLAVAVIPVLAEPVGQGSPAGQANRWPMFLSDGTNPVGTSTNPITTQGASTDNSANSTTKVPVIACRANAVAPAFTEGNQVPCSVDLSGNLRTTTALTVTAVQPVQGTTLANNSTIGAANSPTTVNIAAVAGQRIHIYQASAYCGSGTTATTFSIAFGGVTAWQANGSGTNFTVFSFPVALTAPTNTAAQITLTTCGAGIAGAVNVQADIF